MAYAKLQITLMFEKVYENFNFQNSQVAEHSIN